MKGKTKEYLKEIFIIVCPWITIGGFTGLICRSFSVPEPICNIIATGIAIVGILLSSLWSPMRNFLKNLIKNIYHFFNHAKSFDLLTKINKIIEPRAFNELGTKFLFLDRVNEVLIIHSHRKETEHSSGYIESEIPVDEANIIVLLHHFAASRIPIENIKRNCSCDNKTGPDWEKLKQKNVICIGTPATNLRTDLFQKALTGKLTFNIGKDDKIMGTPGVYYERDEAERIAYGLVIRAQNPFNPNSYITILAGGHRQGQKMITTWFTKIGNLHKIVCDHPDDFIELVIKGKYDDKDEPIEDTVEIVATEVHRV